MTALGSQTTFLDDYQGYAQVAAAQTGLPWQTILAQWADETGYGTSQAFVDGNNFAGISPGGTLATYPTPTAGLAAYIQTILSPTYAQVRNAASAGPDAVAQALGQSPWAGSHYDQSGGGPGSDLVAIMNQTGLANIQLDSSNPVTGVVDGAGEVLGGVVSDGADTVASDVVSGLISAIEKPALTAVFLLGAAALVGGGLYTALKPDSSGGPGLLHKVGEAAAVAAA